MVRWHHQLNGHEFEQTPGNSEGQGCLMRCSPRGCKESDTTEWLNYNNSKTLNICAFYSINMLHINKKVYKRSTYISQKKSKWHWQFTRKDTNSPQTSKMVTFTLTKGKGKQHTLRDTITYIWDWQKILNIQHW